MTIVLTALLAIISTLFLMMARTEKLATSARSDNEELKLAVDSVVDAISQTLKADVPGNFYDYPSQDADKWLANLEPEPDTNDPNLVLWRHIT